MQGQEELRGSLLRRFRTSLSAITCAAHTFEILHPESAEELISEVDFEQDERLPYWADVWPSARVLATVLALSPSEGTSLLELGCGAGLVASAAARAGYEVTATDYYADALLFARVNAWGNAGREIATRLVDWRDPPADLGRFERVVASDVLYELPQAKLVAAMLVRCLEPGGLALLADPGRVAADAFIQVCGTVGLRVSEPEVVPFEEGAIRQLIRVYRITVNS
ncbi:MAG: hypothetical protein JWO05_3513 [Gemmatimonadetes bacterium]|nr:hypothetical protein [Gemmatimonadota bacterium]